jgi:hypothetical protein
MNHAVDFPGALGVKIQGKKIWLNCWGLIK